MKKITSLLSFSLVLILVSNSYAADESAQKPAAKHRDVDISHLMKKPEPLPEDSKTGFHLNVTCKTESGKELTNKDKNYNDCMERTASKASDSLKKKNP